MSDLKIHVGEGRDAMAARFVEAGHRAERVHADIDALAMAGLVERAGSGTALRAPYDTIQTTIAL